MKFASLARFAGAFVLALGASLALAGETAFTQAGFDKAMAAGQPVVVDFQASWCPTCKAQQPIIDALLKEPRMKGVTLFAADYDSESALKKQLRVPQQSTFVVFHGGKEVGRSTGETRKAEIATLFDRAL